MVLFLAAAAAVYLVLGNVDEALVLATSIAAVVGITVLQERKAERALEALRELSSPRALVLRDGAPLRIAGSEVVRGDVLVLAEGDRISADARIVEGGLDVDESLLTGESLAVTRSAGTPVHAGTLVVSGQARAEVFATGSRSELGRIGVSLASVESGKTSLERETARIIRLVAAAALALCAGLVLVHFALRGDLLQSVLAGLTLAMAILPEEFPLVLTVFLALGAWRISRHGVLTRRMPAIEMLGAATVLCVDKTGTLTENRMRVAEAPPDALHAAALASALQPFDPMERAIVEAAGERPAWELVRTYALREGFLAVCNVWRLPSGELRAAVKGAPETVLALSAAHEHLEGVGRYAEHGMRVLAVAQASWMGPLPDDASAFAFRFLGFVALADPLRASVPAAVARCRAAGIRVVMITGDFAGTALRIAQDAGLDVAAGALTGADIAAMDDAALAAAARRVNVFARVRPEQKLRLVQAYRAAGEVVAMTGDGVNDAPALKAAHIGVAMGKRGTDVAREAAALVLLEDDFDSIVRTVSLGRRIYENIRNAMRYLISVHVPIAAMSFLPLALGGPLVLFPVHVVFLEFVIDPACTVVYEAEEEDAGAMQRPPRAPGAPLFDAHMLGISLLLGAGMLCAVLGAYGWALWTGRADAEVRAIAFSTIVFSNLALLVVTRSRTRGAWELLRERNVAFWWIVAGALAALGAALYSPPLAGVFRFAPLPAADLAACAAISLAGVAWYELRKLRRS